MTASQYHNRLDRAELKARLHLERSRELERENIGLKIQLAKAEAVLGANDETIMMTPQLEALLRGAA